MKRPRAIASTGWPIGIRFFALTAAGVLVLAWFGIKDQLHWRALDWAHTSAQFTEQLRLPSILAATAASHVAARLTHRTRIFAQPWSVRVGRPVLVRHLGQLLGWFVPAFLLGLAPLVWRTAHHAAFGGPDPLVIAGALLGFVAFVSLGYLIGAVTQNLLAVPVTVAVVFLLAGLPQIDDAWNAVIPVMSAIPTLGREQSLPLAWYRLLAFVVFCAMFCWFAVCRMSRRRPLDLVRAPLLLVPIALVAFPLLRTPALFTYDPAGGQVCDSRGGVTYCVHEGHRSELASIRDAAAPVIAAFGAGNTDVRQVRDYSLATSDAAVFSAERNGTMWVHITPGWRPAEEVPLLVANRLVPGTARCASPVGSIEAGAGTDERRTHVLHELVDWLRGQAFPHGGMAGGLFAEARPEQVGQWVSREREAIATCTVDPEDLPWR
ncbi:hypothetical protein ACE14D_04870 [Streptomyces sp. Act-28]